MSTEKMKLEEAQKLKWKELQKEQVKLNQLQADLAKLNAKIDAKEHLSEEDTKFISELGWLAALSVTVAAIAVSV